MMKKLMISVILAVMIFIIFLPLAYSAAPMPEAEGEDFFNSTAQDMAEGIFSPDPKAIIKDVFDKLFYQINQIRPMMISVLVIAMLAGFIKIYAPKETGVHDAAFLSCFCLMTVFSARIMYISVGYASDVIGAMCDFITKLAPVLMILLITSGYAGSAASFYPALSATVWACAAVAEKCIIPLIYAGCITGMINNISGENKLKNLSSLIKSASRWILLFCLTVFTGINAVYGIFVPSADSVGIKTAKFAVGSFVPVVGGFLSDSIETVMAGGKVMKNAAGAAGVWTLLSICSLPLLKVLAIMLSLKVCAALTEPVCDKRLSAVLSETGEAVVSVFSLMAAVCVIFIVSVVIIISSTNTG